MMLLFDQFAVAALVLVLVVGGMRLFYGAWPWEARKTWYRTRQAVDYIDALRGEKNSTPGPRPARDAVYTSNDSFDRSLVFGNSPPEVTPLPDAPMIPKDVPASLQKSAEKLPVSRRWLKANRRDQPVQVAKTALLTTDASDGRERVS